MSTWVRRFHHLVIHKYTHNIDVRRGEILIPCTQTIMCGQCVLSGSMLWRGFAWKFSPPSQVIDCAQTHLLKPCMQISLSLLCLRPSSVECHAWLQGFRQSLYNQSFKISKHQLRTHSRTIHIIKNFTTNTLKSGLQTSQKAILALNKS